MIIGGLQKLSLLDYPGNLSAIIFTQGCNFRCHFCYNPMLVWPDVSKFYKQGHQPAITEDGLLLFLKSRRRKLDAVVISGGEPTIQPDLADFITKIKALGYLVKLDTNGTNPAMIERLINKKLIDYLAMDIKAARNKYNQTTASQVDFNKIKKSVKIITGAGRPASPLAGNYEFRTTVVPGLHDRNDIIEIAKLIRGAEQWYLQQFKGNTKLVDQRFENVRPYEEAVLKQMCRLAGRYVKKCDLR